MVAGRDRRLLLPSLAIDEHVDVTPHVPPLIDDPAAQRWMIVLEAAQELDHGDAVQLVVTPAAGERLQRTAEPHHAHGGILRPGAAETPAGSSRPAGAGPSPEGLHPLSDVRARCYCLQPVAGWSSLVARRAHNPKVAGSNPAPATHSAGNRDLREIGGFVL